MSSKFTQTRHTRAKPPVCRAPLRGGLPVKTGAHPAVLIAWAEWINVSGDPWPSITGTLNLFEISPDAQWEGCIYQGNQKLEITVTKIPQAPTCTITVTMSAPDYFDEEDFIDVPCTPGLCGWTSPLLKEIHIPEWQWHSVQVWA